MKNFDLFLSQLLPTDHGLDFYCDFNKISRNVEEIRVSLCMLSSLIGSDNLRRTVETIWRRDKSAFGVLDILVAVRRSGHPMTLDAAGRAVELCSMFESVDGVMEFLEGTGLAGVLQSRKVTSLVDYVFGIETGLDSNARKNRSGHEMERTVATALQKAGIDYRQEVYSREWPDVQSALGEDEKRFDFVIVRDGTTYLIEVNFYSGGGSKLNEVARSYSDIGPKINAVQGFRFVWITDGAGWHQAKNKLHEAYSIIPNIYNLTTIKDFINRLC